MSLATTVFTVYNENESYELWHDSPCIDTQLFLAMVRARAAMWTQPGSASNVETLTRAATLPYALPASRGGGVSMREYYAEMFPESL